MSESVSSPPSLGNPVINKESVYGITFEMRQQFCRADVTLDGKPARISGTRMKFATVYPVDSPGVACQWSWATVQHVISKGGNFISYG